VNLVETTYHYDLESPETYRTKKNRLMYYEVKDITDPERPSWLETVYYEYWGAEESQGNPTLGVRKVPEANPCGGPAEKFYGAALDYNHQGELWFVTQQSWQADETGDCAGQEVQRVTEFKGSGRARYLTRERDPATPWNVASGTAVWSEL
jgi:hypothetical protein